ncbi:MAG: hypothetical protein ACRD8W_19915 [Nitrososphaeraceae archaeon]
MITRVGEEGGHPTPRVAPTFFHGQVVADGAICIHSTESVPSEEPEDNELLL